MEVINSAFGALRTHLKEASKSRSVDNSLLTSRQTVRKSETISPGGEAAVWRNKTKLAKFQSKQFADLIKARRESFKREILRLLICRPAGLQAPRCFW